MANIRKSSREKNFFPFLKFDFYKNLIDVCVLMRFHFVDLENASGMALQSVDSV